jgi:hypothetical protein
MKRIWAIVLGALLLFSIAAFAQRRGGFGGGFGGGRRTIPTLKIT